MADNLILITIDSLRADHVGSYGHNRSVTPTLDRLAEEGVQFTNAVSTASHTKDAFPGMFSSVLPSVQGKHHLDGSYEPLAVSLSNTGYETIGYHSTPMMASYDYAAGFDEFEDLADSSPTSKTNQNIAELVPSSLIKPLHRIVKRYGRTNGIDSVDSRASAEEATDAAVKYLNRHNEPFCLFVHYMDVHTPYWPPREYIDQYANQIPDIQIEKLNNHLLANKDSIHGNPNAISDLDLNKVQRLYDAAIRYVDDSIERLLETASHQDLLNDSLVVITADHGEEFRDHSGFFHGQKLYEELVRVPLVCWGSGIPQQTIDVQISHLGLMPTILKHLGHDVPQTATGASYASLFSNKEGGEEFALAETTIKRLGQDAGRVIMCRHESGMKLIYNEEIPEWGTEQWELYDLMEDPNEQNNIFDSNYGRVVSQMKERITSLKAGVIAQDEASEEIINRLENLGYTE